MIDEDFESLHQELSDKLEDIQLLLLAGFNDFAAEVHAAEETLATVTTLQPRIDRMFRLLDAA